MYICNCVIGEGWENFFTLGENNVIGFIEDKFNLGYCECKIYLYN